ncbi:MAG: hypothetical protein E6R13_00425 [Spirochaetes bacterium]|nr:MAG: hypothetical protein E6R13_00425 [Spirochaetota bacterium]
MKELNFKLAKVVMLPSNEKVINTKEYQLLLSNSLFWTSKIEIKRYTEGWFFLNNSSNPNSYAITVPNVENFKHQHLYIISDDEIKEGEWYLSFDIYGKCGLPIKADYEKTNEFSLKPYSNYCKKIIATTDTALELPRLSQQFIEEYIEEYNKGNVITDVLVEYEKGLSKPLHESLRDSSPLIFERLKINPKDNTITIKKVKDSWNREEVIELCKQAFIDGTYAGGFGPNEKTIDSETEKWIEENL